MKISAIIKIIENNFPRNVAVGDDIEKIGYEVSFNKNLDILNFILTLDITPKILDYAITKNIKLIITHHPLFYNGISDEVKKVQYKNELLSLINKNKITIYAAHTNVDTRENGLSFYILKKIGIHPEWILDDETKLGAIAYLPKRMQLGEIIEKFTKTLDLKYIKYFQAKNKEYKRIAFVAGSGSSLINIAIEKNIELFITSDIPWHIWTQLQILDMDTIEISHGVENEFVNLIASLFKDYNLNIIKAHVPDLTNFYVTK